MATFSERTWEKREKTLGDPAESAFEEWAENTWCPFARYGLNRPPIDMRLVPPKIRYTPDYITNLGLVEVQGCGRDGLFKFKHEKLIALQQWDTEMPVSLWLYDQPEDRGYMVRLWTVVNMCATDDDKFRVDGMFDGYKQYAQLSTEDVQWIVDRVKAT